MGVAGNAPASKMGAVVIGKAGHLIVPSTGAPTDGPTGEWATKAAPGCVLIDYVNGQLYQNTNTKASPTWSVITGAAGTIALADTKILVGNGGGNAAAVFVSGDATLADTGALTIVQAESIAKTLTSATPATEKLVHAQLTLTPATSLAIAAAASLAAMRGLVTLTSGKSITSGYLYGVQGKIVADGATINVGSAHVAGVYGQLSLSGSTLTAGHIAAVIADIQNVPTSSLVDLFYGESATGNVINAMFKAFGKSDYVLDLTSNVHVQMSTTGTVGTTAAKGWLKCLVEGVVRYIPLADAVS